MRGGDSMCNYREYILMNKDREILEFISETNEFDEVCLEQISECTEELPIGFYDIQTFIESRRVPKHRKHIMKLMRESGCDNLNGFLRVSKALSLNDTYWVKEKGSDLKWSQVSLYQNDFNEIVAQLAFDGGNYNLKFTSTSPEYTTNGQYAKCWKRFGNEIYLIKDTGAGAQAEFYASQIARHICRSYVEYDLLKFKGREVSRCKLFTSEKEGFLPAVRLVDERSHNKISYLLKYFGDLGFDDDFRRMIVLDALILNTDRHAGNYGVIVDNETQKIQRMAPVFDHNLSLFSDFDVITEHSAKDIIPRIGGDFCTAAGLVLTPEIRNDLMNLKGFRFSRGDEYGWPEERLRILEGIMDRQIEKILEMDRINKA